MPLEGETREPDVTKTKTEKCSAKQSNLEGR